MFDIEEFTVDLYYWFEKSTKRKNCLRSMTEIYLLFFQSILPTLNCANKFLQPLIHLLQPQLLSLVKKLLSKFVKPSILVKSLKDLDGLYALQCSDEVNQVANRDLVIGFITKQEVNK